MSAAAPVDHMAITTSAERTPRIAPAARPNRRWYLLAVLATVMVAVSLAPTGPAPGSAASPAGPGGRSSAPECLDPLPGPEAVVQLAYLSLLRRCPDGAGGAAWVASLRDGASAGRFAHQIAHTPEARKVVVTDAYRQVLERPAATSEQTFWSGWMVPSGRARRHEVFLAELVASPEMFAQAGHDPDRLVDLLYTRLLGRAATAADRAYWAPLLADTGGRRAVARSLLRLSEPQRATVSKVWREVIATAPAGATFTRELGRFRADGARLALAARLVGSPEFASRAEQSAVVVPGHYVALGDSFVTMPGIGPTYSSAAEDGMCSHSMASYPEVARTLSDTVPSDVTVWSCIGASLYSLFSWTDVESGEVYPGQIAHLRAEADVSLVTLTIGGNDMGFTGLVSTCLKVISGGAQLNEGYDSSDCEELLDEWAPADLALLRDGYPDDPEGETDCDGPCSLPNAVRQVVDAAPDARVVVVGYPLLMASSGACEGTVIRNGAALGDLRWRFDPSVARRGRELTVELNSILRDAAVAAGATYVDTVAPFSGHGSCSPDPWVGGLELGNSLGPLVSSFHPNRRGGLAQARALVSALER